MDNLETIKTAIVTSFIGRYNEIMFDGKPANAYVFKKDTQNFCVFIPCNDALEINEKFSKINLYTQTIRDKGTCLILQSLSSDMDIVASVVLDFIAPSKRDELLKNPFNFYNRWKDVLGNRSSNLMVYDVIGELFILSKLLEQGKEADWNSMVLGTHDIETNKESYEVKSTIEKTGYLVKISSKFQMESESGKPLFLTFVREEKSKLGMSIKELRDKLVNTKKIDEDKIDSYIKSKGFVPGKQEYTEKYTVHEALIFAVDDDFPKITRNSFVGGEFPAGIETIEYSIDLPTDKKRSLL